MSLFFVFAFLGVGLVVLERWDQQVAARQEADAEERAARQRQERAGQWAAAEARAVQKEIEDRKAHLAAMEQWGKNY